MAEEEEGTLSCPRAWSGRLVVEKQEILSVYYYESTYGEEK